MRKKRDFRPVCQEDRVTRARVERDHFFLPQGLYETWSQETVALSELHWHFRSSANAEHAWGVRIGISLNDLQLEIQNEEIDSLTPIAQSH